MQIDQNRRRGIARAGLIVILAGLVGACAEQSEPAPVFQKGSAEPIVGPMPAPPPALQVIVKRGQTLDGYAYTYHVPKAAIIAANRLRPPYELKAGMRLTIPSAGGPPRRQTAAAPMSVGAPPSIAAAPPRPAPAPVQQATIPQPPPTPQTIAVPQQSLPPQTIFPAPQQAATPPQLTPPQPAPPHAAAAPPQAVTPPASAAKVLPEIIPLDGPPPAKQAAPPQQANSGPPAVLAPRNPVAALPLPGEAAPQASAEAAPASNAGRFPWPVRGRVLANYGNTAGGGHNDGINIAAPRGTPVRAVDGGTVAYVGNEVKGYGNLVLIRHDNGWISAYAHLDALTVKQGEAITPGEVIAKVGDSGGVTEPQLHFELRRGKKPVDPKEFLAPSPSAAAQGAGKAG